MKTIKKIRKHRREIKEALAIVVGVIAFRPVMSVLIIMFEYIANM